MKEIVEALFPPDIKPVARWRLVVFAVLVMMMIHIAWACGWLDYLHLGKGFAYADDVKDAQSEVTSIKLELIEQRLFETRIRFCKADEGSRRIYTEKIRDLMGKYQSITRLQYQLPDCKEL